MLDAIAQKFDGFFTFVNWLAYAPRWYVNIGLVALLLFVGGLAYFRFVADGRQNIERDEELALRVRGYERQEYHEAWRNDDSRLLARPEVWDAQAGMVIREQVLVLADHDIRFTVMVPYQDAAWVENSVVKFEHENGSAVSLPNLFRQPEYLTRFRASQNLICVGLASRGANENGTPNADVNDALAQERALNLCRIVAGAVGQTTPMSYHRLPLGFASQSAVNGSIAEKRQRSAVIIGVEGARDGELESALPTLISNTRLNNVSLGDYSQSQNPTLAAFNPDWTNKVQLEENPAYAGAE